MEVQANPARGAAIRLRLIALFCALTALGLSGLALFYGFVAVGAPGIATLSENAAAQDRGSVALSAAAFFAAAVGFAVCGWGAARQRRWVPTILRSIGWIWLLSGVLFLVLTFGMLDGMLESAFADAGVSPEVATLAQWIVLALVAFGGVLLPILLLALCSGAALRAFVREASGPSSRLDAVPEPVLGLSFAMALAALMVLPTVFAARLPVGSHVLGGFAAVCGSLILFGLLALSAYGTFRRRNSGWWLTLVLIVGLGVSALWTLRGMSVVELLEAMGYPEQSVAAMAGLGNGWLVGCTVGITLVGVGQLLWVKRYFRGGS